MKKTDARKLLKEMAAMRARLDRAFTLLGDDESADTGTLEDVRVSLHNINSAIANVDNDVRREFGL